MMFQEYNMDTEIIKIYAKEGKKSEFKEITDQDNIKLMMEKSSWNHVKYETRMKEGRR